MQQLKGLFSEFWGKHLEGYLENTFGDDWTAHSPFRKDHHASLSVNIDTGLWIDFGDDELNGDAAKFLELRYGVSKANAKKQLLKHISEEELEEIRAIEHFNEIGVIPAPNFKFIEVVSNGIKNRTNPNRIIQRTEYPDYYGNPDSFDCHNSICHFNSSFPKYVKANNGSVSGYDKACRINQIPIDIDSTSLIKSHKIAKEIIFRLRRLGFNVFEIKPFFSGGRGFHIYLKTQKLELLQSKFITPKLIGEYIKEAFWDIPEVDTKLYKHTHLIRSVNSIHPKTGLYKIPLTIKELNQLSCVEIRKMAKNQRPSDEVL